MKATMPSLSSSLTDAGLNERRLNEYFMMVFLFEGDKLRSEIQCRECGCYLLLFGNEVFPQRGFNKLLSFEWMVVT